jgi:hypothetical protein
MKAYIVKIELLDSNPLIWRKVIMPAGATFNRLHDIIQTVTNFMSGYPHEDYHIYEFNLGDKRVTNDEDAYLDHKHFKSNKRFYKKRLAEIDPKYLEFERNHQARLSIEVKKPTGTKIDSYIEELGELSYIYDMGCGWRFTIKLEEIVEDYHYGYATLLDGAETAPPEDVGGLDGFYDFLEIYKDESHPDHEEIMRFAKELTFREYDLERTNSLLKHIKYKKTEWDKIDK